jgi:putative nucleotide binding protein
LSLGERSLKKFEDNAYVLDFLPHGKIRAERFRAEPIVQLIGETYFTLLEAKPRSGFDFSLREKVYIGKSGLREKISHIIGRINYNELTANAKSELETVVETIITNQEKRFIEFFNTARARTPRMHSLELIPGIGKKYTWTILEARERRLFTSFQDIKERTDIPDPARLLHKRILDELSEPSKYRLFVRPY